MPIYVIKGTTETGRPKVRRFQALDANTARVMAEQEGLEIIDLTPMPLQPASPELLATAKELGAVVAKAPSHMDCMRAIMGSAWDDDMQEVPWQARLRPHRLQCTAKGIRVHGEIAPMKRYLITGDQQRAGERRILLENIELAEPGRRSGGIS